jgi:hypothetical protein
MHGPGRDPSDSNETTTLVIWCPNTVDMSSYGQRLEIAFPERVLQSLVRARPANGRTVAVIGHWLLANELQSGHGPDGSKRPIVMRVLYVNPLGVSNADVKLLNGLGHEITSVAAPHDALDMIGVQTFSAILLAEEIENSQAFEFISKVYKRKPGLLVFQLSVWRSQLVETLELLEAIEKRRAELP